MSFTFNAGPSFPSILIESGAEFEQLRKEIQSLFDRRWLYERSIASREEKLTFEGTCGVCLLPAVFTAETAGGEILDDQRRVPNWRESLACHCTLGLSNRHRAVAHFLEGKVGLLPWMKLLFFGSPEALGPVLSKKVDEIATLSSLHRAFKQGETNAQLRLESPDAKFHLVLSLDYLQRVPALDEALAEILRVLAPGGSFTFTLPFRVNAAATKSFTAHLPRIGGLLPADFAAEVHEIGWDILDRLRAAGFARAAAHLYWSEELGYFGPYNFIFSAFK